MFRYNFNIPLYQKNYKLYTQSRQINPKKVPGNLYSFPESLLKMVPEMFSFILYKHTHTHTHTYTHIYIYIYMGVRIYIYIYIGSAFKVEFFIESKVYIYI